MSRAFIYYRIGAPAAPRYVRIASRTRSGRMHKDDVLHAMLVFNARTGNIDDNYSLVNTGLLRMVGGCVQGCGGRGRVARGYPADFSAHVPEHARTTRRACAKRLSAPCAGSAPKGHPKQQNEQQQQPAVHDSARGSGPLPGSLTRLWH